MSTLTQGVVVANDDDVPRLPVKFGPVSNGEFLPLPHTPVVKEAIRRAHAMADDRARRLGMSRRRFLTTMSGAAVTWFGMSLDDPLMLRWGYRDEA